MEKERTREQEWEGRRERQEEGRRYLYFYKKFTLHYSLQGTRKLSNFVYEGK